MKARLLIALATVALTIGASWSIALAQSTRSHTVKQILIDGKDAASASGITVTPKGAPAQSTIRRNEPIADGTRIDVPAHVVVVIVSTGAKSTATLEPGASITFVSTGQGELMRSNTGKTLFEVAHKSLDFFRVQSGDQITAGVSGTAFSINATSKTVAFACTSDAVTITRSGYIRIGLARKPITLSDVISATGKSTISYAVNQSYLAQFSTFTQAEAFYESQVLQADKHGDTTARIAALANVGYAQEAGGKYAAASDTFQQALALAQRAGDRDNAARITLYTGFVARHRSQYTSALVSFRQASDAYRELGDRDGEARATMNIGNVQNDQGQYAAALQSHRKALALFRELGDRDGEASALTNIGLVQEDQGQYPAALLSHQQALALYRELGGRDGEAGALTNIGSVQKDQGQSAAALQSHQQALALFRELGDRDGEARALNNIGSVQVYQGQYAAALQSYRQSLTIKRELGDRGGEASTLNNIGAVKEHQGQYAAALQSYQQALAIYQQIGAHGTNVDRTQNNIVRVQGRLGAPIIPSPEPSQSP